MMLLEREEVYPEVKELTLNREFTFFWLKYIRDVDLSVHCARSLIGMYDKKISIYNRKDKDTHWENVILDKQEVDFWYFCGVSKPYKWEDNFHLVIRCVEGEKLEINEKGVTAIIENAVRVPIEPVPENLDIPHVDDPDYYTCRNWMFAVRWMDLTIQYGIKRKKFVENKIKKIDELSKRNITQSTLI